MSEDRALTNACMPHFWEDGYIRMSFERFCSLPFASRRTFIDEDLRDDLRAEDVPALHAGFCEWIDMSTQPRVSVGWAWFKAEEHGPIMIAPGGISSNVMLTVNDRDLGVAKSNELMRAWLSKVIWQRDVDVVHQVPEMLPKYSVN